MSSAQTMPASAAWLAVTLDGVTDRRVTEALEPAATAIGEVDDSRPDLIPWPAHRMLHRAVHADSTGPGMPARGGEARRAGWGGLT